MGLFVKLQERVTWSGIYQGLFTTWANRADQLRVVKDGGDLGAAREACAQVFCQRLVSQWLMIPNHQYNKLLGSPQGPPSGPLQRFPDIRLSAIFGAGLAF